MVRLCCGQIDDNQMEDIPFGFGEAVQFSYQSLRIATNNFSNDMLIGRGGFGKVYRGVLPSGTLIAVKDYGLETQLDELCPRIVEVMSCIRHPNIARVIGYCMRKNQKLLVSEYVDNGTLYDLLHNKEKRESVFNWPMTFALCTGIAGAIYHLHEDANPHVIHRDIKSSNVLLDSNFTPKITDFDLVKLFYNSHELPLQVDERAVDAVISDSGFSTGVVGTLGYVDPEYLVTGTCTPKSDVYGFGVVMLEIISGRKAVERSNNDDGCTSLIGWAFYLLANDRVSEVVDPVLRHFPTDQVRRFIDVAFSCTQAESKRRPSMHEVIQMLNGVCNSWNQPLTLFDMMPTTPYLSAASSFRSSIAQTYDEAEEESSNVEGVKSTETELQAQGEIETCAAQSNTTTIAIAQQQQQQHMGIVLSGSGDLVERLSQTMVFNKSTKLDFPEAVYPPFRTRQFRRGGSRNLYTF